MAESYHPEMLSALLDGELSPAQQAAVEEHLQNHPQDAAILEDLRRLRSQIGELPFLAAPSGFQQSVIRRILESAPVPASVPLGANRRLTNRSILMLACAASLAAIAIVGVLLNVNRNEWRMVAQK